ncbi:hypothetical protein GQ42DRAFT_163061 [Ramicandelaber brevisporus]|nr:hypothetical protein GQ42DRAFT_163061 [Ramicandelaber brevisporus]
MPMYDEGTGGRSMANDQLRLWADVLYARTRAMRENEIERPSQTYFVELSLEGSLKQFEGPEEQWKWNTERDFVEHFYPRVGPHISHLRVVNSQYNKILMDDKPVYYDPILTILKSKLVEVVEGQEVVTEVSFDWNNEVIITHLPHPAVREQVASILKEKKRIPKLERVVLGQYLYDKDPVSAKEFFDSLLPLDVVYDRHPNAHNEYTAVDDPDSPEITDDEEEEEEEEEEVEIL